MSGVSRRKFITAVAATGVTATAQLTPFTGMAMDQMPEEVHLPADRIIKIVSTQQFSQKERERIYAAGKNIALHELSDSSDPTYLEEAEVIFGGVNASMLSKAKKLKWVQVWGAGVEGISAEMIKHPAVLTNMQRTFAPVIAESAIGLLLSLTRGLAQVFIPAFREKKWQQAPPEIVLDDLYKKTVGIVGMGGIGSEIARRLHVGFDMCVLATDAKPMPRPEYVEVLSDPSWLMEMVPQVDVLISAAPYTRETKDMFNDQVFDKMKRSAYFINVSRGGLVDQPALARALKQKKIRGAGLDVATPEPLPPDHELWTCPNLVITPHNSALANSRFERMMALVVENTRRYSLGIPLLNVVDKQKGY